MKRCRVPLLMIGLALAASPFGSSPSAFAQQGAPLAVDDTLLPYASTKDSVRLPDGRTIHLVCMGQGIPVVILTAGAGRWGAFWNKVQPAVAQKTRVCAWDRAGLGMSAPSPNPQTVDNRTTDLQAALKAGLIAGPYVVVGHSLGGYESLLLTDREPSKVVGMVLVDPSFPDQTAAFERAAPALVAWDRSHPAPWVARIETCAAGVRSGTVWYGKPDPDDCMHPRRPLTFPLELRAVLDKAATEGGPESYAARLENLADYLTGRLIDRDSKIAVKADRNYGSMPLIVLTARATEPPSPDLPDALKAAMPLLRAEWVRGHDALAALSTRGVNRVVPDSLHDIPQMKPQAVIDAIVEVVDQARASGQSSAAR